METFIAVLIILLGVLILIQYVLLISDMSTGDDSYIKTKKDLILFFIPAYMPFVMFVMMFKEKWDKLK